MAIVMRTVLFAHITENGLNPKDVNSCLLKKLCISGKRLSCLKTKISPHFFTTHMDRGATMSYMTRERLSVETLFHRKYTKVSSGCWEWSARISPFGYGQFSTSDGDSWQAHRFSYTLHKGKIPKGLCVCHTCDNRKCVNPTHLWVGTRNDNIQDMHRKGRARKATSEKNDGAKISWQEVREIRKLYPLMKSHRKLAVKFNISRRQISRITRNLSWKI